MSGAQARPIECWCPLADSSKSVVKEGTFVFSGEGYLSTVIDIQQHWTASGCTHPSSANHWALPEKFTAPSALESGCHNSPGILGGLILCNGNTFFIYESNILTFIYTCSIFSVCWNILNKMCLMLCQSQSIGLPFTTKHNSLFIGLSDSTKSFLQTGR